MHEVSATLAASGVIASSSRFKDAVARLGLDRKIKAGLYLVEPQTTHANLIDKLVVGQVITASFTIVEGTKFNDVLTRLVATDQVNQSLADKTVADVWELVAPEDTRAPEGMLYPDTYLFPEGHLDVDILHQAQQKLESYLLAAWAKRAADLPLSSPYEALILASIIEKETGFNDERELVASVFINRLNIGMRLQSDPTVIYGLGEEFNGNLTKEHLQRDTPYNTYTRAGLPPTPIAITSTAAIHAALHPHDTDYLYFVADGSGGHYFSKTLREHNNAVNRYQRRSK